jgi:hypothetical protein
VPLKTPQLNRRNFLQSAMAASLAGPAAAQSSGQAALPKGSYRPGRIANEYSLFLPGEEQALEGAPSASDFGPGAIRARLGGETRALRTGEQIGGWYLAATLEMNGTATAVFEKHVTHRGAIIYVTESEGVIARIPKGIGDLSKIRPRPTDTPHGVKLERPSHYVPGPDVAGNYILNSAEDPCYENVAALGKEYIGWTLVANEQAGPLKSLFLEADGTSRQLRARPEGQGLWAPDLVGAAFDPARLLLEEEPQNYAYVPGYSKRTMLGGYLPVADIGVWNPVYKAGYEAMVLLPPGADAEPLGRVRSLVPKHLAGRLPGDAVVYRLPDGTLYIDRYWNGDAAAFFGALAGIWNYWHHFFEDRMKVEIPDPWLLDAARAGIALSRCSYRGLEPTYQIGEGAYTKIPERSHALFPVAHYEFVWAHQLWNLTAQAEPYFQHYLSHYILPDGNFLYNTQDQVEAPLNTGVFLANSARAYDYGHNIAALQKRLPVLRRMIDYVLQRYDYSKKTFPPEDRRCGLIWGSPEADLGDPQNDFPESHPYFYQNAAWTWRGLREHARCLARAAAEHNLPELAKESEEAASIAAEMRGHIERSLRATLAAANPTMRAAGISPFSPDDIHRRPDQLSSYENHRFMMDWFTADWGDPALDLGHLKHSEMAGELIAGLHTNAASTRVSNFMEHGALAVRIRQDDYRPFLLTLYALVCYAADSGNRYSPEDAYIPGSYPGEGSPYGWSAVVNSVLQPALGLRWLLCYEESSRDVCHLQKAAPKHWFAAGQQIRVEDCPTRFGHLTWSTRAAGDREWEVKLAFPASFEGDLVVHIHPPDRRPLRSASAGAVEGTRVIVRRAALSGLKTLDITVR